MHDPVYCGSCRHRVGEHLLPLGEDQVGRDAERAALVALGYQGVSNQAIAKNLGMSRSTVRKYLAAESPEMIGAVVTTRRYRPVTMADDTKGQNR